MKTAFLKMVAKLMQKRRTKSRAIAPKTRESSSNFSPGNDHDIWVLLDSAHFAVTRSRLLELAQFNLTKEQAQVLYVLKMFGGSATMNQIASFTMRQRHSVSTLINRMENAGLVRKVKDPKEKVYKVVMTKKGKNRYAGVTRESIEMIFSSLSAAEKSKLVSLLNELHDKARSLLGMDYKPPFLKRR
jgi:DNA-binding MarR family transcriptional regulator